MSSDDRRLTTIQEILSRKPLDVLTRLADPEIGNDRDAQLVASWMYSDLGNKGRAAYFYMLAAKQGCTMPETSPFRPADAAPVAVGAHPQPAPGKRD